MSPALSDVLRALRKYSAPAARKGEPVTIPPAQLVTLDAVLADCLAEATRLETVEIAARALELAHRATAAEAAAAVDLRDFGRQGIHLATVDGRRL